MKTQWILPAVLAFSTPLAMADEIKPEPGDNGRTGHPRRHWPAKVFQRLDTDKSGSLTEDEFLAVVKREENKEKAMARFARMDKDGDGSLSVIEFVTGMKRHPGGPRPGGDAGAAGPAAAE